MIIIMMFVIIVRSLRRTQCLRQLDMEFHRSLWWWWWSWRFLTYFSSWHGEEKLHCCQDRDDDDDFDYGVTQADPISESYGQPQADPISESYGLPQVSFHQSQVGDDDDHNDNHCDDCDDNENHDSENNSFHQFGNDKLLFPNSLSGNLSVGNMFMVPQFN